MGDFLRKASLFDVGAKLSEISQMKGSTETERPTRKDDKTRQQREKEKKEDLARKKRRIVLKFRVLGVFNLMALLDQMPTIEKMPDNVLIRVFSFLPHKEIMKCARVCRAWRILSQNPNLWHSLPLRPNYEGGLTVANTDALLGLIETRFGPGLKLIEMSTDLITPTVIHQLSTKAPKLSNMTLDFSTAMQLHDFTDLQSFPARLRTLTLCLSENIFLEGFLRKIYNFIASVEVFHMIGTYEKIEDEEEEVYETVNLSKLKQYLPNVRVVNLWGVAFIGDEHIESLSASCAHLEVLSVNFCQKVRGSSLKLLLQRVRKLKCLLLEQTSLDSKHLMAIEWEKTNVTELNISATELNTEALISILTRTPNLQWLSAGYLECFTDQVLEAWLEAGTHKSLQSLDLNSCDSLSPDILTELLNRQGPNITGLHLGGHHRLLETFWVTNIPKLKKLKTLVMGVAEDCCPKVTAKIHLDSFIDMMANNCPMMERLEVRWDEETLRFSDKSSKFVDILRLRCLKLKSLTLSDGKYYELVRSNFHRADRYSVVRTTQMCHTSLVDQLTNYLDLLFN